MKIAVAHMAEADDARAGVHRLDGERRSLDEFGNRRDRNRARRRPEAVEAEGTEASAGSQLIRLTRRPRT